MLRYEGQLLGPVALRLPVVVSIEAVLPSDNNTHLNLDPRYVKSRYSWDYSDVRPPDQRREFVPLPGL